MTGASRRVREISAALLVMGPTCAALSAADVLPDVTQEARSCCAGELKSPPRGNRARRYTIDSARTVVTFEVRSFGIFKQRGWFGMSFGSVSLAPEAGEGTFDVVIDARSIQAGSEARLRIMRGAEFLNVEKFRTIAYKSAHVIFNDGKPIRVEGELTLLGITRPVPLNVSGFRCTPPADADLPRCMMDATAIFKRSEFGMAGSMALAGDRIRLAIHAEATADLIDNREQVDGHPAEFLDRLSVVAHGRQAAGLKYTAGQTVGVAPPSMRKVVPVMKSLIGLAIMHTA
jgi:polyisoprenoid-binding protein YceI